MSSSEHSPQYGTDLNRHTFYNHSLLLSVLPLNDKWILPIFITCLVGFFLTVLISFIFVWLSFRRFNGHYLLTNLFICFSVSFVYMIIIVFLIRANEIFCGLREFLTQLAYAFLFSALLCRYVMQWLGSRILSKRTKQLAALLIYFLLIFIQIPIGILWWYFTVPRHCQHETLNVLSSKSIVPEFRLKFQRSTLITNPSPCSNRCSVDYRFYATFTYTILQLFFCTFIAASLFLCRHCHRTRTEKDDEKSVSVNGNNALLTFFNMFAFILIDFVWLSWTFIYYFSHPFFIFPALIISMFLIATICLFLILFPQAYYYSKIKPNAIVMYKSNTTGMSVPGNTAPTTTLYSNKLASSEDIDDQQLLLQDKTTEQKSNRNKRKEQTLSNGSDLSGELGSSGTFLPITRTPKGPFKVKNSQTKKINEKLDQLIYGDEQKNAETTNNTSHPITTNDVKTHSSSNDIPVRQETSLAPLQRQLTSSSIASDFVSPASARSFRQRTDGYQNPISNLRTSSSLFYPTYSYPRRDETLIPILCNAERPRTSTPLQMRYVPNIAPSSVPTTRRIYSGTDIRFPRHPREQFYPPPPPPPTTPPYYSPQLNQQYLFVDPYRTVPSRIGGNTWQSVLLPSGTVASRYPYPSRRIYADHRSLSQRLWDIDSGDDEEDHEEDIIKVAGRLTPEKGQSNTFPVTHPAHEDDILLHIDDDTEDDSYGKQYVQV